MAISHSPSLLLAATAIATMFLGFGIKFTLQPGSAIGFFEFPRPALGTDIKLVEAFILLYAVRDMFVGAAMYAAAYHRERRSLGWIMVAGFLVAVADGFVVRAKVGRGQWSHWGYAPVLGVVGALLLGIAD